MRATLLLLAALGLASGCTSPLSYYAPAVETVSVWPRDTRPSAPREHGGIVGLILPMIPLVPYGSRESRPLLDRVLSMSMVNHLARTNAFRRVYGPGDPIGLRQEADLRLDIRLLETHDSRVTTTFGLGLPGAILWFIGLPHDVGTTTVEVEIRWEAKGADPFLTTGRSRERTLYWIFEDSEGSVQERAEVALGQAMDQAIRRGMGTLKHHLKRDD